MKPLLRRIFGRSEPEQKAAPPPRVIPPVWASDDDLALLRKSGLL